MGIVIVKLGGAAITDKKGCRQLASDELLDAFLQQIKHAYSLLLSRGDRMILVHGAGSFGHPQAKQYGLKPGWTTPGAASSVLPSPTIAKGLAHIRTTVMELQSQLLARLDALDVPAVSISPFELVKTHSGVDASGPSCYIPLVERTKELLNLGLVPLLNGDLVLDSAQGCTILSGDVIIYQLAMQLPHVKRCIFVTDVHGIYSDDPKLHPELPLLKCIQVRQDEVMIEKVLPSSGRESLGRSSITDVTGGMQTKIKWAKEIVLGSKGQNVEVVICKAGSDEAGDAMAMEPVLQGGKPLFNQQLTVFTGEYTR